MLQLHMLHKYLLQLDTLVWKNHTQDYSPMGVQVDARTRRSRIEERIEAFGEVEFALLAEEFGVSEMTIRRDIASMESQNLVRKVSGGAISLPGKSAEPPFEARAEQAAVEKGHLAIEVVKMLEPDQVVLLDSGSTVLAVAKAIRGVNLRLTVVTPSLPVALELVDDPGTTVMLIGGKVRPGELSTIGPAAQEALNLYNCDVYVMGVAGVDAGRGASEYHFEEGAVKRCAIKAADRVIAVVDQTKLGRTQLINVGGFDSIDVIVTDAEPDHPVLASAGAAGVEVRCVERRPARRRS
ncbi:MAG: DeoR/GlpR family DNA-binding transcription regulator [Bifidobacteriaceae bacterium]|jgi:DeoR/GlpR family transcriptional regulator of sugar metabolism|nr:DeoR/GlpR family DNA-binding transcription regulator [Bifidobacteriaceae bacterium]